ncbi:cysteine hydrolase family protein [Thiohalorhabdus methylotrophus]|uniref:Cysteine hydrolase family protein n=1 Tax=Thiohalorhabdus methylotrophus TaxID=3242694 RepID=A0ABV4TZP3_9GAMM
MGKRATLVVDIQNEYFPGGKLPLLGIEAAAANAARVIEAARDRGERLIHIHHEMPDPDAPIFTPGTAGVEIHESVRPNDGEPVILKNHPNAFLSTDLKERLDQEAIAEVVVVGAMSHMCVEATTRAASDLGYRGTVIHDACATMDLTFNGETAPASHVHATAMAALAFAYASIQSVEEFLA